MSGFVARRLDPSERAGLRLTLLGLGFGLLSLLLIPLGLLVRDQWGPLARLDTHTDAAVHPVVVAHDWLRVLALVVTWAGSPVAVEVTTALLVLLLLSRRRRRSALYLGVSVGGAYLLSTIGKVSVARVRPSFPDPVSHARGASFPSGHATGSAAFGLALAIVLLSVVSWRRLLFALAFLFALAVAASRVLLGVHYPSDVAAGLLVGWGWVAACTALFSAWRAEEGRPAPVLEEGVEA
ncbi:MAG: phosphatase PAP2 family protein [Actinobacteria bacterium]|nr:phosphatase PAP2 family protein [Actinomycetota bacterium]MCA1722105.1 phosphatase PAP2 family protein [Actinomycetota bacterium]